MRYLRRFLYKGMKYILFFLLFLGLLFLCLLLLSGLGTYERKQVCAELPNGLRIGYVAFVKPLKNPFYIYLTLKLPDGTALIKNDYHADRFYFSKSTIYGVIVPRYDKQKDNYAFAYRPDVGFFLREEDPALYKKLKEEAGQLMILSGRGDTSFEPQRPGEKMVKLDISTTYLYLIEDPVYRREDCPLDFFHPGKDPIRSNAAAIFDRSIARAGFLAIFAAVAVYAYILFLIGEV